MGLNWTWNWFLVVDLLITTTLNETSPITQLSRTLNTQSRLLFPNQNIGFGEMKLYLLSYLEVVLRRAIHIISAQNELSECQLGSALDTTPGKNCLQIINIQPLATVHSAQLLRGVLSSYLCVTSPRFPSRAIHRHRHRGSAPGVLFCAWFTTGTGVLYVVSVSDCGSWTGKKLDIFAYLIWLQHIWTRIDYTI